MRMEAGLDTGPVAACTEAAIGEDDTAATLSGRLAPLGAALLARTLPGIAAGTVAPEPQDHSAATLARILKKEDGLLDFRATAAQVAARARGVDPWPGPAAFLGGEPIKLFAPRVVAGAGESGQMLGCTADGLVVACAAGAVAFRELQLPGRKRLPAAAVLAGMRLTSGARLTSTPMPGDRP